MPWIKKGVIFNLEDAPNRSNHTQVPTPYVMDDRIRVYYACRRNGMSFPSFFDISRDFSTIIYSKEDVVVPWGNPGNFDSDGIMPSCVIRESSDNLWMYYIGWNEKTKTARYHNTIGIAYSNDNGISFSRMFDGPVMDRMTTEPGLAVMPFVMYKNWFRMWYQSETQWVYSGGKWEPVYVIKYADSTDGINWNRYGNACVKQGNPLEAFSRPSVIYEDGKYKMWYCYRGSSDYRGGSGSYRIGYAESVDGIEFTRMDSMAGIGLGESGEFDDAMQCYPYVINLDGRKIMFYNGNDFGQSGIGVAVWE